MVRGFAVQNGAAVLKLFHEKSPAHRVLAYHLAAQASRNAEYCLATSFGAERGIPLGVSAKGEGFFGTQRASQ